MSKAAFFMEELTKLMVFLLALALIVSLQMDYHKLPHNHLIRAAWHNTSEAWTHLSLKVRHLGNEHMACSVRGSGYEVMPHRDATASQGS